MVMWGIINEVLFRIFGENGFWFFIISLGCVILLEN